MSLVCCLTGNLKLPFFYLLEKNYVYDTCTVGTGNKTGLSQMLIDHEALCSEKKRKNPFYSKTIQKQCSVYSMDNVSILRMVQCTSLFYIITLWHCIYLIYILITMAPIRCMFTRCKCCQLFYVCNRGTSEVHVGCSESPAKHLSVLIHLETIIFERDQNSALLCFICTYVRSY